jgi:hypothetical protein
MNTYCGTCANLGNSCIMVMGRFLSDCTLLRKKVGQYDGKDCSYWEEKKE